MRSWPRNAIALLAAAGGSLLVAGSLLPWLSLDAGLDPIRGIDGVNGQMLALAGALSVIAGLIYAWRPSRQLRYGLAGLGFVASGFAAWVASQVLGSYQQLQADPLVLATLGSGAFVALGGALIVLGTLLVPQRVPAGGADRQQAAAAIGRGDARTVLLSGIVAFLVSAAMIHLAVVGPHLQESVLYAAFFITAAIAQLVAAMTVTLSRPRRWLLLTIAAGSALMVAVWALSRTVGLPIGPTPGVAESVSLPDVIASVAEVVVVVLSVALALIRRPLIANRVIVGGAAIAMGLTAVVITTIAIIGVQAGGG
jgi:hypothetical protein